MQKVVSFRANKESLSSIRDPTPQSACLIQPNVLEAWGSSVESQDQSCSRRFARVVHVMKIDHQFAGVDRQRHSIKQGSVDYALQFDRSSF